MALCQPLVARPKSVTTGSTLGPEDPSRFFGHNLFRKNNTVIRFRESAGKDSDVFLTYYTYIYLPPAVRGKGGNFVTPKQFLCTQYIRHLEFYGMFSSARCSLALGTVLDCPMTACTGNRYTCRQKSEVILYQRV